MCLFLNGTEYRWIRLSLPPTYDSWTLPWRYDGSWAEGFFWLSSNGSRLLLCTIFVLAQHLRHKRISAFTLLRESVCFCLAPGGGKDFSRIRRDFWFFPSHRRPVDAKTYCLVSSYLELLLHIRGIYEAARVSGLSPRTSHLLLLTLLMRRKEEFSGLLPCSVFFISAQEPSYLHGRVQLS